MKTRLQDIVWGALAGIFAFLLFAGLGMLLFDRTRFVETLVGAIPLAWIVAGCWRRTKWGAPEDGLRAYQERRAMRSADEDQPPA